MLIDNYQRGGKVNITKLDYSLYFEKLSVLYNGACVATYDYRFTLDSIKSDLISLGYIKKESDLIVSDEAKLYAKESNLFNNPIKDN
tara:strand:- start:48 stop:308 length:261 start_codon:yes stop_codon:yes gene_type:complete